MEIRSIGGYYLLTKEVRISVNNRDVFYVTGCAAADTSCCGSGGFAFANVPGYILSWKEDKNPDGLFVSAVVNITDAKTQKDIIEIIKKNEGIAQINFSC